jgi:hypothetical protein
MDLLQGLERFHIQNLSGRIICLFLHQNLKKLDHHAIVKAFRDKGEVKIREGNGKTLILLKPDHWKPEMGKDWVYLLFDLFQIRTVCEPFSEVSLDVVEYGTKPTIYHSPVNGLLKSGPIQEGNIQFSLIREPNWNKLLFQISHPVLAKVESSKNQEEFQTALYFPLLGPSTKELFLGPEGDVKILNR